ncbi:MAG: hypothetical protein ACERKO_04130 [Acetanaerobacterium sp.]
MKKVVIVCLSVLALVALLTIALFFIPIKKNINTQLTGKMVSFYDSSKDSDIIIILSGEFKSYLLGQSFFSGRIQINNMDASFSSGGDVDIQLDNNVGYLEYLTFSAGKVTGNYLGYVCTKNFESLLILLYDENSIYKSKYSAFICAPAASREEAIAIASKLSQNNWMNDIEWDIGRKE